MLRCGVSSRGTKLSVGISRVKCMFDSGVGLPAVGTARLAGLIEQNHNELMARECRMLQLACAWADAHYLDSGSEDYQPLIQRACAWGGEGTPEVSEYCAAELGALQGTGMAAARALIADALDLRYRLPRLWDRVLTGGVRAWQARKIAEQTRPLSWEACADVDHALSDFVGMMPWPRFAKILSATILEADPAQRRGAGRAGAHHPRCVQLRLRGRAEDHRGQGGGRRCHLVPSDGEPDR